MTNLLGFRRFSQDIKNMLGFEPGYFWQACWAVVSPLFLIVSLLLVSILLIIRYEFAAIDVFANYSMLFFYKIITHIANKHL